MKKQKQWLSLFAGLFLLAGFACAQGDISITAKEFKVEEDYRDIIAKTKGLQINADLYFSKYIEDYNQRKYVVTWRLEDLNGKVVYDSRTSGKQPLTKSIRPGKDYNGSGAKEKWFKMFIPYRDIDLPEGKQEVFLVVSAENELQNHPGFLRQKFSYDHKIYVIHPHTEQEFTVPRLGVKNNSEGFGSKGPGMTIDMDLGMKYGPDEIAETKYTLYWKLLDASGKEVFDCRNVSSIFHQKENVTLSSMTGNVKQGIDLFIGYKDVKMDGPGEGELVILLEAPGHAPQKIYSEKMQLDIPAKFKFADQKFILQHLQIEEGKKDGVQGITAKAKVAFELNGVMSDPEKGPYTFHLVLKDASGKAILPEFDARALDEAMPEAKKQTHALEYFFPYRELKLPPRAAEISYALEVTDKAHELKWPQLGSGKLNINPPPLHTAKIEVHRLVMASSNYDTKIDVFGNKNPDIQWRLVVGDRSAHKSATYTNSLTGPTGSGTVFYAEGDAILLTIWDIDKGIWNPNDKIGSHAFQYWEKGKKFSETISEQGHIRVLEVSFEQLD